MGTVQYYISTIHGALIGERNTKFYFPKPYVYNTLSVNDLATHIAQDSQVERARVQIIVDSLLKQIQEMVLNGHPIDVPHLGRFRPTLRSKQAVNELYFDISQTSVRIAFQPCTELKNDLKTVRFERAPESAMLKLDENEVVLPGYWYSNDPEDNKRMLLSLKFKSSGCSSYILLGDQTDPDNFKLIGYDPQWEGKYLTKNAVAGDDEVTVEQVKAAAILVDQTPEVMQIDHDVNVGDVDDLLDELAEAHVPFTMKRVGSYKWGSITTEKQRQAEEAQQGDGD